MADKVTFGDLHRLLANFGFKPVPGNEPYSVFQHEPTGALQAFGAHRPEERVDAMTLAAVRMTLVENGFLERDEFEDTVREVANNHATKAKRR